MTAAPEAPPDFSAPDHSRIETLRTPPYSIEAEEAVIGGLLIDNEAWDKIADLISAEDFFKKENSTLFRAVTTLAKNNDPFDAVTLSDRLRDIGTAGSGTLAYLASLVKDTPSAANIEYYARIVLDKSVRRRLIAAANRIIEESTQPDKAVAAEELLDAAEAEIFSISDTGSTRDRAFVPLGSAGIETYNAIDDLSRRAHGPDNYVTGIATGFYEFDRQTSGLQQGDLVIIAGRPSTGKSTLVMNIVAHAAIQEKQGPIAIFSLEMSAAQLAMRFFSSLARIDQQALRRGQIDQPSEFPRLTSALTMMQNTEVYIDDSSSLTPLEMRARVRRLKRDHGGLAMVVVDYLQLLKYHERTDNRVVEISEISRSLKALAREMKVPVVALSQLNRESERSNRRPIMADLRDSGAIEQDADVIAFIYHDKDAKDTNVAEIHVAKQRNGPQFETRLTFLGKFSRFENYTSEKPFAAHADGYQDTYDRADLDSVDLDGVI